ncbi:MAG: DUF3990 domain-containing protein [Chitinispirillales bacterium]|jgi:hypothetical protein|nr:DUF3990 domain-containing protein [Chitinispirillales bacterium]
MQLFHASNLEINSPKLVNRTQTLDFGGGFYTTSNREQAEEFALKVYARRKKEGSPTVNVYDLDERAQQLNILKFESPSNKWLDFVVHNRRNGRKENYDLIVGPVANDDVFAIIVLYEDGQLTKSAAIRRFKVKKLFNQYVFCTEKALSTLAFIESYKVKGG